MMNHTQVIFCGENPEVRLVKPDNVEAEIAFASYWRCTYSPLGGGHFLALHLAAGLLPDQPAPLTLLAADNLPLGRMLTDDLVRHFPNLGHIPFTEINVDMGNLSQASDGRKNLRVECHVRQYHIEVVWDDVLDVRLPKSYPNNIEAVERGLAFDVSTVICPVGTGRMTVNGVAVNGKVHSFHDGTMHRSTAFLAFSETWVRHPLVTAS
jgi:hypothetical protein